MTAERITFLDYEHVVVVPRGLSKTELLQELGQRLSLPPHFGANFDALCDCLSDLSWLPPGRVLLLHEDLPLRGDDAETYLDVLQDAMATHPEDRLEAVFPQRFEEQVRGLARRDDD